MKKSVGHLLKTTAEIYEFIRHNRSDYELGKMCAALKVTRSGYYRWERFPRSRRAVENERLLFEIRCAYDRSRRTYGSPRITAELQSRGVTCSRPRVARLMRHHYIYAKTKRRYRITTHSKHNLPIADDLVKRRFIVPKPNQVWVSDITYISTGEGWLYLAVIMDLYSRRVIGWSMKDRLYREIVLEAFQQAIGRRNPPPGLIVHSDHGTNNLAILWTRR